MTIFEKDGPGQWQAVGEDWNAIICSAPRMIQSRINDGDSGKHVSLSVPYDGETAVTKSDALVETLTSTRKMITALGLKLALLAIVVVGAGSPADAARDAAAADHATLIAGPARP